MLVAYAKIALKAATSLRQRRCRTTRGSRARCADYFPQQIREQLRRPSWHGHPLRREIVTTVVVNAMVNRGGITFAFRAQEETGADAEQVARAFVVCREVFGLADFVRRGRGPRQRRPDRGPDRALPRVPPAARPVGALVPADRPAVALDIGAEIERFRRLVRRAARRRCPTLLRGEEHSAGWSAGPRELAKAGRAGGAGAPRRGLAARLVLAAGHRRDRQRAPAASRSTSRRVYYLRRPSGSASTRCSSRITALPRDDRWEALARGALRDDLYAVLEALTRSVLDGHASRDAEPQRSRRRGRRPTRRPLHARQDHRSTAIRRLENPSIAAAVGGAADPALVIRVGARPDA